MNRFALAAAVLACSVLLGSVGSIAQTAPPWRVVFDGSSLEPFDVVGAPAWSLVNGAAEAATGPGSYLVTKQAFGNFDLRVEFWAEPDTNSGVFIRCANPKEITDKSCYEVNIFDQRPDPIYRTGGIVHFAKPMAMIDAGGRWNTFEISARGPRITANLNGTRTAEMEDGTFARGPVALQYGRSTIRVRKVEIREYD
jgi:hypothetical protein